MRTTKKLVMAAALAVALIASTASPASAAGPFWLEADWGHLNTAIGTLDLGQGSQGVPPCPDRSDELTLHTDWPSAGRYSVSGSFSRQLQLPAGSGNWYWAHFTILSGSGTYSGGPWTYTLAGHLVIRVEFYSVDPNDCWWKASLACRVTGQFAINSSTSAFYGSLPNSVVGDFATIEAVTTSGLVASPCNPPFNTLNGSYASLTDLRLTVL